MNETQRFPDDDGRRETDHASPDPSQADGLERCLEPCGPPQAVEVGPSVNWTLAGTSTVLVIGGLMVLGMVSMTTAHTAGATRSHRLQWEERNREIQQAVQQEQVYLRETAGQPQPDRDGRDE